MRGRWGRTKRRVAVAAVAALAIAVIASLIAPGAGAVVGNPGALKVLMKLTIRTPSLTIEGVSTEGTGAATLATNGLVNIPQASLVFASTTVHVDVPSPPPAAGSTDTLPPISPSSTVVVTIVPTSDFYGGVDPNNGSGFLVGNVKLLWDQAGTLTGCTVGPFRVVARTSAPGATPYSPQTGKVAMVDPGFTIDALPTGAAGCGGYESGLNSALSLPVTTTTTTTLPGTPTTLMPTYPPNTPIPVPSVVVSLTFTPAPRRAPIVPVDHPTTPPPNFSPPPNYTPPPNVAPPPVYSNPGNGGSHHHRSGSPPPPSRRHRHHAATSHHRRKHTNQPGSPKTNKPRTQHRRARGAPHTRGTWLPGAKPVPHHLAAKPGGNQRLNFVTTAFVKPSPSVLSTGLDILAFIALLVFSSLALWLVTSEVSNLTLNARRLRTHRIAGVTRRR